MTISSGSHIMHYSFVLFLVHLTVCLFDIAAMPFGVSIAASIRVGHLIGGGHVDAAKLTAKIAIAFGSAFMGVSGICMASARDYIGSVFSGDAEVVRIVATIAPIGGLLQVFDGVQGSSAGVLRGLGLQRAAAISNLVGLVLCGVGSAYLFAFVVGIGLPGLWWGLTLGLFVTAVANVSALFLADWQKQVEEARERVKIDEAEYIARREDIQRESDRTAEGATEYETQTNDTNQPDEEASHGRQIPDM
jgi:MATE family multidrug resistance protein